jgi:hypothetical protein
MSFNWKHLSHLVIVIWSNKISFARQVPVVTLLDDDYLMESLSKMADSSLLSWVNLFQELKKIWKIGNRVYSIVVDRSYFQWAN